MMTGDLNLLSALPHRLRELRLEMGWSLEDVVQRVGVTQRGVVSNWEATNQRRRTPSIPTLIVLQRWYGVSMDYLLGHPRAERDSPDVKMGKKALRAALRYMVEVQDMTPDDRARRAVARAMEVAPEAFFEERIAAVLLIDPVDLAALMKDRIWSDVVLGRLTKLLGIPSEWFYDSNPSRVLELVE